MGSLYHRSSYHAMRIMIYAVPESHVLLEHPHPSSLCPKGRAPHSGRMICCEVSAHVLGFAFETESPRTGSDATDTGYLCPVSPVPDCNPLSPQPQPSRPSHPAPPFLAPGLIKTNHLYHPRSYTHTQTNQSAAKVTNVELS
jgi:hypothetical protein